MLRFDGSSFTSNHSRTEYDHNMAYFAKYDGNPFNVGDSKEGGLQTEILVNGGTEDQSWNRLTDYPYGKKWVFITVSIILWYFLKN